jgi:hypothetical protein
MNYRKVEKLNWRVFFLTFPKKIAIPNWLKKSHGLLAGDR